MELEDKRNRSFINFGLWKLCFEVVVLQKVDVKKKTSEIETRQWWMKRIERIYPNFASMKIEERNERASWKFRFWKLGRDLWLEKEED